MHERTIALLRNRLFLSLACVIAAFEITFFRVACLQSNEKVLDPNGFADGLFSLGNIICIIVLSIVFFVIALLFSRFECRVFRWCFKFRYPIALALLVLLVICRISGSSIGMLTNWLDGDAGDYLGVLRNIRRDEWVVNTPLALSQTWTGFSPVSNLASGGNLDLTLVYAQACWSPSTLFKPFLWGYLILPSEYALSYFWCARLIFLFMVSFEFGRFIACDNKRLALFYAALMTFSPLVQWWFAVNFIAEILIFSQLFILLFRLFLSDTSNTKARVVFCALGMAYCACAFIFALYPAWQVPVGYIMTCICIALIIQYLRKSPGARSIAVHALVLVFTLAAAVGIVACIIFQSYDTVKAIVGSEYPGARLEVGGGLIGYLFTYALVLGAPIDPTPIVPNVCERAAMFSLFPLGTVLALAYTTKKRDGILIALLIVNVIFLFFGIFGFPAPLAKLTLLSNVTVQRLILGLGIVEIMLLVRSIALARTFQGNTVIPNRNTDEGRLENSENSLRRSRMWNIAIIATSIVFGIFVIFMANAEAMPSMRAAVKGTSALFIAMSAYAILCAFRGRDKNLNKLLLIAAIIVLTGLLTNPIQIGLSRFEHTPLATAIEREMQASDGDAREMLWVADDSIIAQACIAYGVPSLNSVALYPHNEIWEPVDQRGEYKEVYNRYAHVRVVPSKDRTKFELTGPDGFTVSLDAQGLKDLGVSYWVSKEDLTSFNDELITYELVERAGTYGIYHLTYSS